MELLIVGAGAVGSVYGYYASRCLKPEPVRVTYLIKPKHRNDLSAGIRLYHWRGKRPETLHFRNFSLIDSIEEVAKKKFDAVLITLPSDKMRAEGWLEALLIATKSAEIWSLQPNPNDGVFIREKMKTAGISDPNRELIFGGIPIVSYLAPLPGEAFPEPGYAFYIPPGSKASWSSSNPGKAERVAQIFNNGGLASKVLPENDTSLILPEAFLRCLVAGLEKSEWSFTQLLNGPNLPLVVGGIREMTSISAKLAEVKDPGESFLGKCLTSSFGIRSALRIASIVVPFDFEAFLRVHFTKVNEQMQLAIKDLIESASRLGIPATNLKLLRGRTASR